MIRTHVVFGLICGCLAGTVQAAEWAVGVGVGSLGYSDYPGSADHQIHPLILPYVVYRGERVTIDPQGARARLARTDRMELDVSLGAGFPVNSEHAAARRGMADLDAVVEVGPSLEVDLARWNAWDMRLKLQARSGFALNPELPQVGWRGGPHIDLEHAGGDAGWRLKFKLGADWVDQDMARHYFGVGPEDTQPWRPIFDAQGGYAGTYVLAGASRYLTRRIWVGGVVQYRNMSGASFEGSPLVETPHAFSAGVVVAYLFARSDDD